MPVKSVDVLRALGCTYSQLVGLLRDAKIPRPAKDSSGDYVWLAEDVQRASEALRNRRRPAGK